MKLNRSLPCLAATVACLLTPLTAVYGQTTTPPIPIATGSITCKMISLDLITDQVITETSTFGQVTLQKHLDQYGNVSSYGVLSRWGGAEEVMYSIFIQDPIPVGTTVAPLSGSFIGEDGQTWDIEYDELGQLTFKLDGRGKLTVTGTSFATPPNYFIQAEPPLPVSIFGTCTWNLKGNV